MELADETHIKRCNFCGKKIDIPVFYRGYVFCSIKCRDSFISSREKSEAERSANNIKPWRLFHTT